MSAGARFVSELEGLGVRLWEESGQLHFRAPKGIMTDQRRSELRRRKDEILEQLRGCAAKATVIPDPGSRHEPFPLTDVQTAYFLGARPGFPYGGVSCHSYTEIGISGLDTGRLEAAWNKLILRHDMLRAVIDEDGSQHVLPETPFYALQLYRGMPEGLRRELSHRMRGPGHWPLFELAVSSSPAGSVLHFSIDFLIADYVSIQLLIDELWQLYSKPEQALRPLSVTFREYQQAEHRLRAGSRYEADRDYWLARIEKLPPAPELPLLDPGSTSAPPLFHRCQMELSPAEWMRFRDHAGEHGLTASAAVMAAYVDVIARWSRRPEFLLDITVLQRLPLHPEVMSLVGDFTSIGLLAVESVPASSFTARALALQERLWQDLDHRLFSGIEVLRELARRRGPAAALMPIVYTSAIGLNSERGTASELGKFLYGISQTPQVWIDCQAMEREGGLFLSWDVRDGVFPEGLVEEMFATLRNMLEHLARERTGWTAAIVATAPERQLARRRELNARHKPLSDALLQDGFTAHAAQQPSQTALISASAVVSYAELLRLAKAIAESLAERGCRSGENVAVMAARGPHQVAAAIGVLLAGAVYLPIDVNQPAVRRDLMLGRTGVRFALTESRLIDGPWPDGIAALDIAVLDTAPAQGERPAPATKPDNLAYIIHTSGSTGAPKGVMVSHRAAVNTILDMNRRFAISPGDRVLALSSPGFDLSIYDVFGILAAGGCVVFPEPSGATDPSHWCELVVTHKVTLWNSVPAQMQMLAHYMESERSGAGLPLRMVWLSGDWIPVNLPAAVSRFAPAAEIVSLGGATEAAIWSVYYRIGNLMPTWRSIPYGFPLTNQAWHVLDSRLLDCPDWTPGELYIGGAGLAAGYFGEPEKTAERFIYHPETGERLYRTGDMGRYMPDGAIEFLGREDLQVKIRGHRIELAEIECALQADPNIAAAAAIVDDHDPANRRIAAFVETAHRHPGNVAWPEGAEAVSRSALNGLAEAKRGVDCAGMVEFGRQLDRTALLSMLYALEQQGLFENPQAGHSLEDVLAKAHVTPRHHRLIRRWLSALEANGLLRLAGDTGVYSGAPPVDEAAVEAAWRRTEQLQPVGDRRTELLDYFRTAGRRLPELMRGELDPMTLLFPEGRTDIHEVAYHDSFLGRYLNRMTISAISRIVEEQKGGARVRILEAGAGVGGTSIDLIPALAPYGVEYLFTDVSPFFLNNARDRFGEYPWVQYGIFDINSDYRPQGLLPNSFDVVLCANVLHYARHAGHVLDHFRELLKPGGWLVFIEMVRDNYQVLTSMEFLFDSTVRDFDDVRRGRDATFITLSQWRELVAQAGGELEIALPGTDDLLSQLGFHVFAARFKTDRERADPAALADALSRRLPEYMLPARIEVVDKLPLTANGKVDRGLMRSWLAAPGANRRVGVEPADELEKRIAAVWGKSLGGALVGRDQDFFELGGDSLLASQLAGRLREEIAEARGFYFDTLLRFMLEGPTVARMAERLRQANPADEQGRETAPSSPLIRFAGSCAAALRVVVHDASGTLASYDSMLGPLGGRGALAGLAVSSVESYLGTQSAMLVERIAAEYARVVLVEQAQGIHLAGYDGGGIIALEVARNLLESGARVLSLTLIGSMPPPILVDDDLLVEYLFLDAAGADPMRLGFPARCALRRAIQTVVAEAIDRVPAGSLSGLTGDAELRGVAWCFRRLASHSEEDRLMDIARLIAPVGMPSAPMTQVRTLLDVYRHSLRALALHETSAYAGDITLLCPIEEQPVWPANPRPAHYWSERCLGNMTAIDVPGDLRNCVRPPHAESIVDLIVRPPAPYKVSHGAR